MTHEDKEPLNDIDLGEDLPETDLNDTELDDLELQDLLKDHEPSDMPGTQSGARSPDAKQSPTASRPTRAAKKRAAAAAARRKKMLLQGLAGACGIALLIGLGSLCIRAHKAGEYEAELQQLEAEYASLSADNEKMNRENEELSLKVYNLEHNLVQMAGSNEYIEGEAALSDAESQILSNKLDAYTLLVQAQEALILADHDALKNIMAELGEKYTYLDDNAMEAYYTIMEQMEQPNLGE